SAAASRLGGSQNGSPRNVTSLLDRRRADRRLGAARGWWRQHGSTQADLPGRCAERARRKWCTRQPCRFVVAAATWVPGGSGWEPAGLARTSQPTQRGLRGRRESSAAGPRQGRGTAAGMWSDGADLRGLRALGPLLDGVFHFLVLIQRAVAARVDRRVVDGNSGGGLIRGGETEPLVRV